MNIKELLQAVQDGEIEIQDLSLDEADAVLDGYKQVAEGLLDNAETRELGEAILAALDIPRDDPFEDAIAEAESRGSTYWELETDSVH